MRAVVQRVCEAAVSVDGECVGAVGRGLLIYLGVGRDDTEEDLEYLVNKIAGLRIFPDEEGRMNRSVADWGGAALVISQFTLYGDVRKGKRPSFGGAMAPASADRMYRRFVAALEAASVPCERGVFGATMAVQSTNDGPVTILLDSKKTF